MNVRCLLATCLALACGPAVGQSLESVLAPGPVIQGHAKAESECRNCHMPFKRAAQDGLCLDCHKEVGMDMRAHTGFHGRLKPQPCRACHTDHRGREAKIAPLDERAFDHTQTDFALRGAHAAPELECRGCHVTGKKFREAPGRCIDCHAKRDVHKGRLGKACGDCHGEANWKETRFDHGKTRFPLRGAHAPLKCASCHQAERFKDTPSACAACHRKDDAHKGALGTACGDCHTERDWKQTRFDHSKARFALRGAHVQVKCASCHKNDRFRETPSTCVACHRKDDRHKGALGEACGNCHSERNWKESKFDHARTVFPLLGSHARVRCESCHRDPEYQRTPKDCFGCHQKDDRHQGQLGKKCDSCHDAGIWTKARFDHGRTRFPLLGAHLVVQCRTCHASSRFKDAKGDCVACHEKADVHKRRLGPRCETCHNARSWKSWDFNHDRQTKFLLDGGHRKVGCYACHRQPVANRATLPTSCISCHAADDVHDGGFGKQCERCHVTSTFKRVKQTMGMSGWVQ